MTIDGTLLDTTLEAVLTRRAARAVPDGLLMEIVAEVGDMPQARRSRSRWPTFLAWSGPMSRLAAVAVVVGLVLVMVAGGLFIASRPDAPFPRHPAALVPPREGLGVPPVDPGLGSAVVDGVGAIWAIGSRGLLRADPSTDTIRTWSGADDAAFVGVDTLAPARGGGVWLVQVSERRIRWFDGEHFADVLPAPGVAVRTVAEASDGSLWAVTDDAVSRWDGTSWATPSIGRPATRLAGLAIDDTGDVWVAYCEAVSAQPCRLGLVRFDGERWVAFVDPPLGMGPNPDDPSDRTSLAVGHDGTVWIADRDGLARLRNGSWTAVLRDLQTPSSGSSGVAGLRPASLSAAPDDSIWVGGCQFFGLSPSRVLIAHVGDRVLGEYDMSQGLPETWCATPVAAPDGVYAGTDDGLYRLTDGRWERAWPSSR